MRQNIQEELIHCGILNRQGVNFRNLLLSAFILSPQSWSLPKIFPVETLTKHTATALARLTPSSPYYFCLSIVSVIFI